MMKNKTHNCSKDHSYFRSGQIKYFLSSMSLLVATLCCLVVSINTNGQDSSKELLQQYIKTKGSEIILFDASNIKQYWVDNSVFSKNDRINILLNRTISNKMESISLKVQLANVNGTQDCTIDVISKNADLSFSVFNNQSKKISTSSHRDDFVQYHIASSSFHLADTTDFSFSLIFQSDACEILAIDKIVLSFSRNANYLSSPGAIKLSQKDFMPSKTTHLDENNFILAGKQSKIEGKKFFVVSDKSVMTSVTAKNTGDVPARIYVGFRIFAKDNSPLDNRNYPFNRDANEVLNVVLAEEGSKTILVDSYPKWTKNCYIGLNAKEDLSDLPNKELNTGKVVDIKKIDENRAEIEIDKPLNQSMKKGTKIRIHGQGGGFLYVNMKDLRPGEEETYTSEIKLDNQSFVYSAKGFPKGTYCIQPILLSYSTDLSIENSVLISDYEISF